MGSFCLRGRAINKMLKMCYKTIGSFQPELEPEAHQSFG